MCQRKVQYKRLISWAVLTKITELVQARRAKLDELQGEKALVNREANEIEKNVDIVHKEAGLLVTVWNLVSIHSHV